jgi:hypothetical protein
MGEKVKAYKRLIEHLVKGFFGYLGTYGAIIGTYVVDREFEDVKCVLHVTR